MTHTVGTRQAQKEKTRRALLEAALVLLEDQSLSSLGLREVTRAVGLAPTAFYRHFGSTEELGVALVDEALGSLHAMIGTTLAAAGGPDDRITAAVDLIAGHVRRHPSHVRFLARERYGGVRPVREEIARQLDTFAVEVGAELARQPESAGWPQEDVLMLAGLYVEHMVVTAAAFLDTVPGGDGAPGTRSREEVAELARRRLRLIRLGRRHWLEG
ncbi:TetR family transcriptional regulator [Streptomyces sp. NPDC050560]|uniref:TetR family transcriptional regulator n=1 Tax=Streptomyces sp. NPDC050560 TaxID=3365630 RepID=UPI00379BF902